MAAQWSGGNRTLPEEEQRWSTSSDSLLSMLSDALEQPTTIQWQLKDVRCFIAGNTAADEPYGKCNILIGVNVCRPVMGAIAAFVGLEREIGVNVLSGHRAVKNLALASIERKLMSVFQERCIEDGMYIMPTPASEQWATLVMCAAYLWLGFLWLPRRFWGDRWGQRWGMLHCGHSQQLAII